MSILSRELFHYTRLKKTLAASAFRALPPLTPPVVRTRREPVTTCDEAELQVVSDLYTYGDAAEIRTNRSHWPSCLQTKKIWVFEQSRWHPLDE
jgi:hypothetical protein